MNRGFQRVDHKMTKPRKRTCAEAVDDGLVPEKRRSSEGAVLSLTKPSYMLQCRLENVRIENCRRLWRLLGTLIRQHNWVEASGVLSTLMIGSCMDKSPTRNRLKYWAVMEIHKHIGNDQLSFSRKKNLHETWMKKIGPMKKWPLKDRFAVQSEYILCFLMEGNIVEASRASMCLMQEQEVDPKSNMVIGLTLYELWYSNIPKELQLTDQEELFSLMHADKLMTRFSDHVENSARSYADSYYEVDLSPQCYSDKSVMNNEEVPEHGNNGTVEDSVKEQRHTPYQTRPQDFYISSSHNSEHEGPSLSNHSDNLLYASIFSGHKWDPFLLPLRLPSQTANFEDFVSMHKQMFNSDFKRAMNYLQKALHSTDPELAALHPLVQLLILAGKIKEALNEVERLCGMSSSVLPLRLRARILEQIEAKNSLMLSACFEDILKKDPTCGHSLDKLIGMHQNGDYALESLLEMIALHLEATYAAYKIWKEFALCFLKLSVCEEDRISTCVNGNESRVEEKNYICSNKIPLQFIEGKSGREWRRRCRWWLTRHFSNAMLESDMAAGDVQYLACKAACASHMYGCEMEYVTKVKDYIEKESDRPLLLFLQTHMRSAIGLYRDLK